MALRPGTRLGVYEISAPIGAGGMGEVYRARDPKLNRDVALKVLPDDFATDPERLARFKREAQVLASLNHPNIAAIYGLEDSGETHALVLELVEGPTLQDRIAQGAIPLDEALPIAKQIAQALEAAHEHGIIHRDLKPANIKVTSDGVVKVLDFGLAKALEPEQSAEDIANSPTMSMTAAATKMGMIMGTAAYMSPEQAKGKPVDKRTDIWAFGVVLFEMLTGRQAFGGTDISETLASVLKTDLNFDALPADVPRGLRRVLSRCLQKDRADRSRDIGDVRLDLAEAITAPAGEEAAVTTAVSAPPAFWQRPAAVAAAALLLGAAIAGVTVWSLLPEAERRVSRFTLTLPVGAEVTLSGSQRDLAVSPDGTRVVYSSGGADPTERLLFVREVGELGAAPLRGGEAGANPFFSADGEWVGFRDARDNRLKRVPVAGGPAVTVCDCTATVMRGATWGRDDTIVFATVDSPGLMAVSAAGGAATELTNAEPGTEHIWPAYLPDGRDVLFTIWSGSDESAQVAMISSASGEVTVLLTGGSSPQYLSSGHIVYGVGGTLRSVGFDADRLELTSATPVPVVEDVGTKPSGAGNFALSSTGTLIYVKGGGILGRNVTPAWIDRSGQPEPIVNVPPGNYGAFSLSPDGGRLAIQHSVLGATPDIWTLDLLRTTLTRVTTDPAPDGAPLWTPDGQRIVFSSIRGDGGRAGLYSKAADGTGEAEVVLPPGDYSVNLVPSSWSPDGTRLLFSHAERGAFDISMLSIADGSVEPLIITDFAEDQAVVAPDGGWLAYASSLSGRSEIYLQRFPELGDRIQVSTSGGWEPVWSPDGRQLYYRDTGTEIWVVSIDVGSPLAVGAPQRLFNGPYLSIGGRSTYAISPDGERFLMLGLSSATGLEGGAGPELVLVQNWDEELKARVPTP